jgi:tRNA C32,U32 (ribose-2'-O)-methylase TrmJ
LKSSALGQLEADSSSVAPRRADSSIEEKTRRLVRRLNLSAPDAELLLGLLRNLLWKLRH